MPPKSNSLTQHTGSAFDFASAGSAFANTASNAVATGANTLATTGEIAAFQASQGALYAQQRELALWTGQEELRSSLAEMQSKATKNIGTISKGIVS